MFYRREKVQFWQWNKLVIFFFTSQNESCYSSHRMIKKKKQVPRCLTLLVELKFNLVCLMTYFPCFDQASFSVYKSFK
jgi:hypothetical protein